MIWIAINKVCCMGLGDTSTSPALVFTGLGGDFQPSRALNSCRYNYTQELAVVLAAEWNEYE